MHSMRCGRLALVLVLAGLLAVATIGARWFASPAPATGQATDEMAVDADPTTGGVQTTRAVALGATFTVDIHVTNEIHAGYQGYQVKLAFEETIVNATAAAPIPASGFCPGGAICIPAGPTISNAADALGQGSVFGGEGIAVGVLSTFEGAVYRVTLQCIGSGTSPLDLRPPPADPASQNTTLSPSASHPTTTFDAEVTCGPSLPTETATPTNTRTPTSTPTNTPTPTPTPCPDSDGDGLTDCEEAGLCTDPANPDTDADDLLDGAEVNTHGTDPCDPDSDGDALTDGSEVNVHLTDPLDPDSDSDFLPDGIEISLGLSPLSPDTDGDGVPDLVEDTDNDGLTNGEELFIYGTDPGLPDSDSDGCADGEEAGVVETLGGQRDPLNPWDFFDVPVGIPPAKNKVIDLDDAFAVIAKFGAVCGDPVPAAPTYDEAYDRSEPTTNPWSTQAPDCVIDLNEFFWSLDSFGHTCFPPP